MGKMIAVNQQEFRDALKHPIVHLAAFMAAFDNNFVPAGMPMRYNDA